MAYKEHLQVKMEKLLKKVFSEETKVDIERLGQDSSFELVELDSIMAININQVLERSFGELPKTILFEYPTITGLAEYFVQNYEEKLLKLFGEPSAAKNTDIIDKKLSSRAEATAVLGRNHKSRKVAMRQKDIAIIGIDAKFPMANNIEEFWKNLVDGRDCIEEIPKSRWDIDEYYSPDKNKFGTMYSRWGGFIEGIDTFDPLFFSISPPEAEIMDPQERVFLQCAYNAMANSGYTRDKWQDCRVGVYVGLMYGQYQLMDGKVDDKTISLSSTYASVANRVSYHLNLTGPSIVLDTMCSSSLTTVHIACESIKSGECDYAIAGGVSLSIHPNKYIFLSQQKFLSSDGKCRSFGAGGDGYVPSEGVGAVVLKSLDQAIADGDHIYAVIKGSAINHGGKTTGYTVPNPTQQAAAISTAIKKAGINPRSISYLEAHGTGTVLGDPIEISGLARAYKEHTDDTQFCSIGSVKSNIGHCESAAGIASIIKVILQMQNKMLVPSIHSETLNENINFKDTPFFVQKNCEKWDVSEKEGSVAKQKRRAGISSMGAGGANAHIILEEYVSQTDAKTETLQLIPVSARTKSSLVQYVSILYNAFQSMEENTSLESLAYTLQTGREPFTHRIVFLASNIDELRMEMKSYLDGISSPNVIVGDAKNNAYSEIIDHSRESELFIETLIQEAKFEKIAVLWTLGALIHWSKLWNNAPRKMALPGYPFDNQRYWIAEYPSKKLKYKPTDTGLLLYNVSDMKKVRFSSDIEYLKGNYSKFAAEGKNYYDGALFIMLFTEALTKAGINQSFSLDEITWNYSLVNDSKNTTVQVELFNEGNSVFCEITENEELVLAQARAHMITNNEEKTNTIIDGLDNKETDIKDSVFVELRNTCKDVTSYMQKGLSQFVSLSFNEKYRSHSQEMLQKIWDVVIATQNIDMSDLLPTKIGSFSMHPTQTDKIYLQIDRKPSQLICDIKVMDESGIIARINNMVFEMSESIEVHESLPYADFYYIPDYAEKPITKEINQDYHLIVFVEDESYYPHLYEMFNSHATYVSSSNASSINNAEYVDFYDEDAMQSIIKKLAESGVSFANILYIPNRKAIDNVDVINTPLPLFYLAKSIMQQKIKERVSLVQLYLITDQADDAPLLACAGFMKSLKLENPKMNWKNVGIDDWDNKFILEILLKEYADTSDTKIQYRNCKRYAQCYKKLEQVQPAEKEILLTNGTYVVIGGTGGLGKIFAEYLSNRYQANLILTGTKQLNTEKEEFIKQITNGNSISYRVSDVCDLEETRQLIEDVKGTHGKIDGVFFCAGLNNDSFVLKKTKSEFLSTITTKVLGSTNLELATRDKEVDYLFYFSSIAGETGNIGQSDYAYSNAFLDEYSTLYNRIARSQKIVSIAWPLWRSDGMHVSEVDEKRMAEQIGMLPIVKGKGIKAFQKAIHSGKDTVIFVYGVGEKINKIMGIIPGMDNSLHSEKMINSQSEPIILNTKDQAISYVKEMLSSILKISTEELREDVPFEEYGIESIVISYINEKLEMDFPGISKTIMYEYQNIQELAHHLAENYTASINHRVSPQTASEENSLIQYDNNPKRHNGLKKHKAIPIVTKATDANMDIAIIGISGKYPMAENVDELWENLVNRRDCVTRIPSERWDNSKYYHEYPDKAIEGKTYCNAGGFIKDVDLFDAAFFGIAPKEAVIIDPQERLFLESAWSALEDAGYSLARLKRNSPDLWGASVGVFVGTTTSSYNLLGPEAWAHGNYACMPNVSPWSIANRVSYLFGFSGPSMPVDTACSSSITALYLACESLKKGDCEVAIAGGVNLYLHPYKYILMSQNYMLSPTGHCHSFSDNADGFVPGEGVGTLVLKPLENAKNDRDFIYGVIKGVAINHGGRTNGYTVPNPVAQKAVVQEALNKAGMSPTDYSYLEAHGTGTKMGDPIEINALNQVFEEGGVISNACTIGTIKSNIGHTESTAAIASITKILLQYKNQMIAPSINGKPSNSNINFDQSYIQYQDELTEWKGPDRRIAGVSSFGAGGANGHVVLSDHQMQLVEEVAEIEQIIIMSAKTEGALCENAIRLADFLERNEFRYYNMQNIAYTLQVGREEMKHRAAFCCENKIELIEKLRWIGNNQEFQGLYQGVAKRRLEIEGELSNERICSCWVDGGNVDWYTISSGDCISVPLPSYSFQRERYWVDNTPSPSGARKGLNYISENISTFECQKFETVVDVSMLDTTETGTYSLSNETLREIIYEAAELSGVKVSRSIDRMRRNNSVRVSMPGQVLETSLYKSEDNLECEIGHKKPDGEYEIIAQTTINLV